LQQNLKPAIVRIFLLFILLFSGISTYAQKPCEYDFEVRNDSINFRETKKQLIYEREIGKKSSYAFVSLINDNGYIMLNFQKIQKSDSFIETECFDKDSRIFLQLSNGRIYTLIHEDKEICSARYPDVDNKLNIRVLNTFFYFTKDDFEDLKKYPVNIMQIRYGANDKTTYVMEKQIVSKNLNITSHPESIFMNNYYCVE
jgi:hypothetical protein